MILNDIDGKAIGHGDPRWLGGIELKGAVSEFNGIRKGERCCV